MERILARAVPALGLALAAALPARAEGETAAAPAASLSAPSWYWRNAREHAPLAAFSVGSLAAGGILYSLRPEPGRPVSRDLRAGLAAAGLSAAVSGACYLYYTFRLPDHRGWDLAWGAAPDGAVAASLRFAFAP